MWNAPTQRLPDDTAFRIRQFLLPFGCLLNKPVHVERFEKSIQLGTKNPAVDNQQIHSSGQMYAGYHSFRRTSAQEMSGSSLPEQNVHVLIVDDDKEIRSLLSEFLERNGLHACHAPDGDGMHHILKTQHIDLIVLDLNLPGEDGLSLCRKLRSSSSLPVIMLTAKTSPTDRVIGLETGADDYLCKPFEPLELLSRIRSVLRRTKSPDRDEKSRHEPSGIYFSGWKLDLTARHLVSATGVIVSLSGAEFRLLRIFLDHPNRILSRDQLMDMIHGRDATPFDRSIDLQVSRLRQRIEEDAKSPSIIKTVRNAGYVLATSVTVERQ